MKIIILINDITLKAGTERAVVNLANCLAVKENLQITILSCSKTNNKIDYYIDEKVNIDYLGLNSLLEITKFKRAIWYTKFIFKIKKYIKINKPNIIIGTMHNFNSLLPLVVDSKCKNIGCEHLCYNFSAGALSKYIRKVMYKKLDYVVTLTDEDALNYKKINKNVIAIPNNISFYPDRGSKLDNKIILSVGRLTYQKGFDMLIDIFKLVNENHKDWKLRIVGDGELKEELEEKINVNNLKDYVELVGTTNNVELEYKEASIYAMASRYEGFPMVLLEAKSYGLPCISFDCPTGPKEIINQNKDGIVVDLNDIKAFGDSICELIENNEIRKQYGINGRKDVLTYSETNIRLKWLKLFENLCEK